jgi:hypothetical protein
MSRPRRVTRQSFGNALIGVTCGVGCVLPLLFVAGVLGGAGGRPLWSVGLLVAVIGTAALVFILPALLRQRDESDHARERNAGQSHREGPRVGDLND